MDVRTETAVTGFISRDPRPKHLRDGLPLLVTQLGQKQYRREDDGTYTLTDTCYTELILLGPRAEQAASVLIKGDDVIATGEFRTRQFEREGQQVERLQFRAIKIVHDTTHPRYAVHRTPRSIEPAAAHPTTVIQFHAPAHETMGLAR